MSQQQHDDMVILAHIREQHRLSLQSYGRPRMTEELQELGLNVGHRRVGRLMQANGIKIVRTRKYKLLGHPKDALPANGSQPIATMLSILRPTCLIRCTAMHVYMHESEDFSANRPNQKWAGDICYIWTGEGWLYLAVIIDLYSRRVVGWATSNRMKRDLAIQALDMASPYGDHRKAAFIIRIAGRNTVHMTIRSILRRMASKYP